NVLRLPALTLSPLANEATTAQFDLSLSLSEDNGTVQGVLIYATALFDESTVRRYLGYWQALLRGMADRPLQSVQSLPMLAEAERRQVLVEFNQTRADSPDEACLHALFEAQAARDQDAVALCCDGQTLRYGELNARANQLAHWLYELGVRPDSRVALVLERGVDLIVAMLATLKAGGAYVPLDPGVPPERLRYMLDDSDPTVVLTSRALRGQLGALPAGLRTIELDGDSRPWTQCPAVNSSPAQLGLTQNHLAYVIYTSGSSGQPKGVMVTHRGVVNLVRWHC
ncbi:AMP-binding protein, partial [Pectobacterium odoriferum]